MTLLAHFTPAELPGSFALLLVGVALGATIAYSTRDVRCVGVATLATILLTALAIVADPLGLPVLARLMIDMLWALSAGALALWTLRFGVSRDVLRAFHRAP